MKRLMIFFTAVLLFSILTGGCAVSDPPVIPVSTAGEESDAPVSWPLAERLVGLYRGERDETGEIRLALSLIEGMLIAETEQEYAAYFAAELLCDDPAVLRSAAAQEAGFTAYVFSGFSQSGDYWEEPPRITLSLTESGLSLTESDGTVVEFRRDDTLAPLHTVEQYAEILPDAQSGYPPAMVGVWRAEEAGGQRITLRLHPDGTLLWCGKTEGKPAEIYMGMGAYTQAAEGNAGVLTMVAERVGYARMPWQYALECTWTSSGELLLKNGEDGGLLPTDQVVVLTQFTEQE